MTIKKRYKRELKHNMSLYVSTTLLTMLSLLLFYLYYVSGTGIMAYQEDVFAKQNIEDAHFSTFMEIPEKALGEYEEKYNLILEKQEYINIETGGVTARVFQNTEKVDIPYLTEGNYPEKDNEILISEGYAVQCNVKPGDTLKIKDREYVVTGFAERPDYLYMLQNLNDTDKNVTSFYLCYMTDRSFEKLGSKSCQYLAIYNEKSDTEAFRKAVNEKYVMSDYVEADNNFRITMLTDQPVIFIQMAYAVLFTLPLLSVILISIILSRKIRNEQKMIGTLAAYGYTKKQLIGHYAGFSAIPGIAGGIITTVVIALVADAYGAMGLMDYEPLDIDFKLEVPQMLMGILIPTAMYILSSAYTVNRLLKHNITELLGGSVKGKTSHRKFLAGKNVSFRTKFSARSILGNKGRTFTLFLGVFLGGFVILWGLVAYDTMESMGTSTAETMGEYNYQYSLNELKEENPYGGETVLAAAAEDKKGNPIGIMGADKDSLLALKDEEGNLLESGEGYIATSLYAEVAGVKAGDTIDLINPLSMKRFSVKITAIADNNFSPVIYTSIKNASELSGIGEEKYNVIISREKLEIPEDRLTEVISRDNIEDQYESVIDQMGVLINVFIGIGIFLCIIAVYISVNMIITENKVNISMLNVLGYDHKKINSLLLRDNIFVVILAVILSIPCAIYSVGDIFGSFTDELGYLIEVKPELSSCIASVILVFVSYALSLFFVKRKTGKIDMVESLKDNRE